MSSLILAKITISLPHNQKILERLCPRTPTRGLTAPPGPPAEKIARSFFTQNSILNIKTATAKSAWNLACTFVVKVTFKDIGKSLMVGIDEDEKVKRQKLVIF